MLSLKRTREETAVVEAAAPVYSTSWPAGRSFQCKTCNKEFPSFQALGGHRASHNKPNKLVGVDGVPMKAVPSTPAKPKRHNCSICGTEFPMGQALGGHMRKHQEKHTNTKNNTKNDQRNEKKMVTMTNSTCSTTTTTTSSTVSEAGGEPEMVQRVIKRPRVVIFGVDLSMVETEKEKDGRDSPALLDLLQ